MEVLNRVREIANKTIQEVTSEDKAFLKERAAVLEIEFNPRPACKSCYIDLAIQIYKRLSEERAEAERQNNALYRLKSGVDVIWRGIRINAATITDEKAEQYLRCGFPSFYFEA